jgi:hypothetical protein
MLLGMVFVGIGCALLKKGIDIAVFASKCGADVAESQVDAMFEQAIAEHNAKEGSNGKS